MGAIWRGVRWMEVRLRTGAAWAIVGLMMVLTTVLVFVFLACVLVAAIVAAGVLKVIPDRWKPADPLVWTGDE